MNFILKPQLYFTTTNYLIYSKVFKETMFKVIISNNDEALGSSNLLQTLGVESVAKQEISRVSDRLPLTCCNKHKFNQIMSNSRALQMKRLQNEHCFPCTFISDVRRSKIELKFVIKQLKM
jgi:hypothetical protein